MKGTWHQQFKRKPKESRTSADGITHDSVAEMRRWEALKQQQRLGIIRDLQRQVAYPLRIDDTRAVLTPTGRVARYTADFCYQQKDGEHWREVIEDSKGFMDKVAELRIAVFEAIYQKKVEIYTR